MHGNEACVHGAIAAGCRYFAGYPITPASEIAELMSYHLPRVRGVFVQMEDEIGSICSVIGAAWGGFKAMTATSGPGFSLMQEGIGYAVETETPCVVIDVMRGGPATGQPTKASQQDVYQARYGSHGDYEIIVLAPSSVQEAFDLTVKAFNYAEIFRNPVVVLSDEIIGHTREKIRIPDKVGVVERRRPSAPPGSYVPFRAGEDGLLDGMPAFNQGYRILVDGQFHDEMGLRAGHDPEESSRLVSRICRKISANAGRIIDLDMRFCDDARIIVISYGSVARPALRAVRDARANGIKAGYLKLRTIWPFPDEVVKGLAEKVDGFVFPEMNLGKMVRELERACDGNCRIISLPKVGGNLHTPNEILTEIERMIKR